MAVRSPFRESMAANIPRAKRGVLSDAASQLSHCGFVS